MGGIKRRVLAPPKYQDSFNGPLNQETQDRLNALRTNRGYTLADLGKELGFSGPFLSTLLRPGNPASVRTVHMDRFIRALEELEIKEGFKERSLFGGTEPVRGPDDGESDQQSLDDLVRAIHARGFSVTLTPLPSV